jgi:tRNA modification GTPase
MVLVVLDASEPPAAEDDELLTQVLARSAIVVENKCDLNGSRTSVRASRMPQVRTSAVTGEGIPQLRSEILRQIGADSGQQAETGFLTNVRHQALVRESLAGLDKAGNAVRNRVPHEMLLLDLYAALRPLDEITGATTNDDILNLIFSSFCIGK